jgi:[acyl-carrier-protein] S-malonyltransferase
MMDKEKRGGHTQMKAFVFPGQGTQTVGMGADLYAKSRAARRVLNTADKVLGFPMSRLMMEGPQAELDRTINAQPAILTVSLACLEATREAYGSLPEPTIIAGHSLGEYTGLVAAGALDAADAIRLVRRRGELMQQASITHPGGMAAILGLDEFTLDGICQETGAKIANINSDTQIVISGHRMALAMAVDLATARGARKTVMLPVSGAFHSIYMWPARAGLAEAIDKVSFSNPQIPIVANTTATPLRTAKEAREELLSQLSQCVQWKRSVQYMSCAGVSEFVEFGPGKVLSGLIKRIDAEADVVNVSDVVSAAEFGRASAT